MNRIDELNDLMEKKLSKLGTITHPRNGNVCHVTISNKRTDVVQTAYVYVSTAYGGCYITRYGISDTIPLKETRFLESKRFQDPLEAYHFISNRANEVNKFFSKE